MDLQAQSETQNETMNFQPTRKNKYIQSIEQNFKNLPYLGALKNSSVNELQQTSRSNISFGPK